MHWMMFRPSPAMKVRYGSEAEGGMLAKAGRFSPKSRHTTGYPVPFAALSRKLLIFSERVKLYRLILDFPLFSGDLRTVPVGQFFDIAGEQLLEFDRGGERVSAYLLGVGVVVVVVEQPLLVVPLESVR